MTIREMHIEVQQGLQQVAANRSRKYLPEELDLIISKMIERFVTSQITPAKDGKSGATTEAIANLVVPQLVLPAFIVDERRYKAFMPENLFELLSDESDVNQLCGEVPTVLNQLQFITHLRQSRSAKAGPPYYQTIQLQLGTEVVNIPTDLPYNNQYQGYQQPLDISFLQPWILSRTALYWESFDSYYYPSSYILVSDTSPSGVLTIDGLDATVVATVSRMLQRHPGSGTRNWKSNRMTSSELIPDLMRSSFYRTSHYAPISEVAGNNIWIYRDGNFTVNAISITYVRNCTPVSLSLGVDCELYPQYHRTICDLTIEYIKGEVENEKGRALKTDDLERRVKL